MKRFLFALLLILGVAASATAQGVKNLIEIDPASFRPVQTDVLTGVNIDPIGKDRSQRACARIKLHINRMTPEQINQVQVVPIGGNIVVMKRELAYEGNGLIIELTAKPQTRLYLHHNEFGDSNEVALDLQGNKEYFLAAQLNQLYPITVNSSAKDADVYIDNRYCGKTNSEYYLLVHDILPGEHTLRVEFAGRRAEMPITVHKESLVFRCNVDTIEARPQYVVFHVQPKNAIVIIDEDKNYTPNEEGIVSDLLANGTYTYRVEAKGYHPKSGTFTVSGAKVDKSVELDPAHGWLQVPDNEVLNGAIVYIDDARIESVAPCKSRRLSSGEHKVRIVQSMYKTHVAKVVIEDGKTLEYAPTLEPDFATVSVTTEVDGCELWIDDKNLGSVPWKGRLASGIHILELRKASHKPSTRTITISVEKPEESINMPAPTPIMGTLDIKSTPFDATVYIDGEEVGATPVMWDGLVGDHSLRLSKDGYSDYRCSVKVVEGETKSVNYSLAKKGASYSSSSTSTSHPSYNSTISPSSSNKRSPSSNKKSKKDGFNVGISLGGGYSALSVEKGGDYSADDKKDQSGEFNLGFVWRMWRYDSLFNVMTGVNYMRTFKCNFISVPLVVNLNYMPGKSGSVYAGIGAEPMVLLKKGYQPGVDVALSTHLLGFGWRNGDFNIYLKYMFGCELMTVGCRFAYFF